jgi:hypothetical protein
VARRCSDLSQALGEVGPAFGDFIEGFPRGFSVAPVAAVEYLSDGGDIGYAGSVIVVAVVKMIVATLDHGALLAVRYQQVSAAIRDDGDYHSSLPSLFVVPAAAFVCASLLVSPTWLLSS